jgi:hypothetical protein
MNKDIANGLITFEREVLRRVFWRIKVNQNGRKRYNIELMLPFGDLDILSFVRIRRLNWIGHVNRMDKERSESNI